MNSNENAVLSKIFYTRESCYTANGDFSVKYILEILQDAATEHAEIIGLGREALADIGKFWVLTKISVDIYAPLAKELTVTTWPRRPNRFFAPREFVCRDANGEKILAASSLWSVLDIKERKLASPATVEPLFKGVYGEEAGGAQAVAAVRFDETFTYVYTREVRYSDIDRNGHANNTSYAVYAADAVFPFLAGKVRSFAFDYHCECLLGDKIDLFKKIDGSKVFVVGVRDKKTCFTARFVLE